MNFTSYRPSIQDEIVLKIESTIELESLYCVVMQDSKVVHKEIVEVYFNKEYELKLLSTEDMKPSVNVVVFYTERGQIIHDELTINFVERDESFVRA